MRLPITIREGAADDLDFIYSTWLKNYYSSSLFAKRTPRLIFFKKHHDVIDRLLERGAVVLVAAAEDDPNTIIGYLAYETEEPCVHFLYTKSSFRGFGVARALLEKSGLALNKIKCSHWTFVVDELIKKHPQVVYDPYLMF